MHWQLSHEFSRLRVCPPVAAGLRSVTDSATGANEPLTCRAEVPSHVWAESDRHSLRLAGQSRGGLEKLHLQVAQVIFGNIEINIPQYAIKY